MQAHVIKKMKEGAVLGIIYLILMTLTLLIPSIEMITLFILPIPFVVFASRYGVKSSIIFGFVVVMSTVLLTLTIFMISLPLTLLSILGGTMIGIGINAKLHPYETWMRGTLGVTAGLILLLLLIEVVADISIADQLKEMIQESVDTSQVLVESLGFALSSENLQEVQEQMLIIIDILPAMLLLFAIGFAFITQWISYQAINWRTKSELRFPLFRSFLLPKSVLWLYFIAILISWFNLDPTTALAIIILNVTILLGALFSLQGFSFILFYAKRKKLPKIVPVLIIIVSIMILPVAIYLVRMLGIIDVGFMLRKKMDDTK